jgi:hypothetical protein
MEKGCVGMSQAQYIYDPKFINYEIHFAFVHVYVDVVLC